MAFCRGLPARPLHSAIVMEKRAALNLDHPAGDPHLLAVAAGHVLVRSGVLTSVHAFATDPARGVFILAILTLFVGGSLALFALRGSQLTQGDHFIRSRAEGSGPQQPVSGDRDGDRADRHALSAAGRGGPARFADAPFFDLTFVPLTVPLLFAVPFDRFSPGSAAISQVPQLFAASSNIAAWRRCSCCSTGRASSPLGVRLATW